jgi:quaternary ammonium compound-resistance protein SugE
LLAGAFEVGFTTALTLINRGWRWAELIFIVCIIASFGALQQATKVIPIGMGYAVWTGIGAAGTLLVSALVFKVHITPIQYAFIALLIVSILGLKLTGQH